MPYDPDGNKYNELISKDYSYIETWSKAIHGLLYDIEGITPSVYDTKYYKEILNNIKTTKDDFMRYLEEKASCIEYIDSIENLQDWESLPEHDPWKSIENSGSW